MRWRRRGIRLTFSGGYVTRAWQYGPITFYIARRYGRVNHVTVDVGYRRILDLH